MATYALSLYGEDFYGADVFVSYSVGDVSAVQTGFEEITLSWTTPINVQNWGELRVVRNTAGYPVSEDDGDVLLQFSPSSPQNTFTDSGLTGGRFYYYSIFLSSDFDPYAAATIYQPGDTVAFNGFHWVCVAANVVGVAPSTSVPQWQITHATAAWHRAGQAASLAVRDYGYRDLLYDLIPTAYATAQTEVSAPQDPSNDAFYRYMSVLAWGLSITRTELGEQEHLHRVSTMPLSRLELLAEQLNVSKEASVTPRLRRYRVQNAAQLGQRRGIPESIKETIYDLTGYDSEISFSRNMMLDADQAEAYYPRFSAWDPSVNYQTGAIVQYGDYLYSAKSATVREEAELLPITLAGVPSYILQSKAGGVQYSNQQILFLSNATGQAAYVTFSIPATGSYDLAIGMSKSYDYGIIQFAVDDQTVPERWLGPLPIGQLRFDGYAPNPAPATSIYLGKYSLTAGNHTIKVTVVRKNPNSGKDSRAKNNGFQMGVDYLTYTPIGSTSGVGVAPTGTTANNAFWTRYTAAVTHALDNNLTGGISTWEQVSFTAGATPSNAFLDVVSGYQKLSGSGDYTANLMRMRNGTGVTATLAAHSIPHARTLAWDATTVYQRGAYVSYAGRNYLALMANSGVTPDVDRTYWSPESIATTGTDRYLVTSFGIPLPANRLWAADVQYQPGEVVEYRAQIFRSSASSKNTPPTGSPTDNSVWAWVGPAQRAFCASAWTMRQTGTGSPSRAMYVEWYDEVGNLITTVNPVSAYSAIHVPFARNSADYMLDGMAPGDINNRTWVKASNDIPSTSSGILYWSTRTSNAAGRQLYFSHQLSTGYNVGITFMTAPPSGIEHGIVFRGTNAQTCWTASRTRLAKVLSGTITTVASWPALPDGTRMFVSVAGTSIKVFKYVGAGLAPLQIASVTDNHNETATNVGLFERSY
ncbi:hypothetical protein ACIOHC_35945 [Streptomyces sp. NPDC088252]|uniref:hypothetical protein n=1 Tax=Streptomyces sp. NPDC088252 TaxID=3365845 RepID=UPI0037FEC3BF